MKIITAADFKFKDIVNLSINQTKLAGYNTHIYSISNSLGFGEPFDTNEYNLDLINNLNICQELNLKQYYRKLNENNELELIPIGRLAYKPYIIRDSLKYNEFIVWLDADAFIIKDIDEINDNSYDIGITIRPEIERVNCIYPILNGYINAGVLFFNNTENTKNFINEWIKEIPKTKFLSDQEALNRIILKYKPNYQFNDVGEIFTINNIKIKTFSTREYNWYYYPEEPLENTKIIHIKNNLRNRDIHHWFIKKWN